jgi:uncharacterized membrane-anchored protein YitT (DUF2179 family)
MFKHQKWFSYAVTFGAVILSSLLQVFVIKVFVNPANLLSSGFTGVAILLDRVATSMGGSFPTSLGLVVLNLPVAIICYHVIGKKIVISSLCQVFLTSILLRYCSFSLVFDDIFLNVCFGGVLYGLSVVIALRGNTSTAGTDFIALYVSNKNGKSIWEQVFIFNALILCIFGFRFGWMYAGYSIVFQFLSTKTISSFYQRYKRVTLQITTKKSEEVVEAYISKYRHGISVMHGYGGYSKEKMELLHTVVSSYEVQDIVTLMKNIDPKIIVNILSTENFYGGFYQQPLE